MSKKRGIVVLGSGPEAEFVVRNIKKTNIPLLGYGPFDPNGKSSSIHEYCLEANVPLVINHADAVNLRPDFIFMVSYAPLISQDAINQVNFINVHGSLLPRFRGMHGGTWALINGDDRAGFSIHKVDKNIDTGPIYFQHSVAVKIDDDINKVRDNIKRQYDKHILDWIQKIFEGAVKPTPQDETQATHVCRRYPEDSAIDWNWSSKRIHDFIRALAPPYTDGAFAWKDGHKLHIGGSEYTNLPSYLGISGQVVSFCGELCALIKTGDSALKVKFIQNSSNSIVVSKIFQRIGTRLDKY